MLPPGVTIGQYVKFASSALLSMFLGSHVVHTYYRPLKDLDKYIEKELDKLPNDMKDKVKSELQ